MRTTTVFTSNTTALLGYAIRRREAPYYLGTVIAAGTWTGGTLAYYISPDGGTTKVPMKDASGVAITSTADDDFDTQLGTPSNNSQTLGIYGTLSGAGASPSITVTLDDNR